MMTTRQRMQKDGHRALKVWCQDDNGGSTLVKLWHVVVPGATPAVGELRGGHETREEAWKQAEDAYEWQREPVTYPMGQSGPPV